MVAVIELTDVPGGRFTERRVAERRLGERRVPTADVVRRLRPSQERRTAHPFQGTEVSNDGDIFASVSCLHCGYGEAGHLTLTGPEQEVVTGLLNQRETPALMRRSILRKLTSRLHVR